MSSADGVPEPTRWGAGLHTGSDAAIDAESYSLYIGRWSALFVPTLLTAARAERGARILDVATGPGEAALLAAATVGSDGGVVASDISLPMLRAARTRLPSAQCPVVAADGAALPFSDGSFQAVICQLGLMFMAEPTAVLREFGRVLRPGCFGAVCVISRPDRAAMWGALADALSALIPQQRQTLQLSFALADPTLLAELFTAAGFEQVQVQLEHHEARFESFDDYWKVVESATGQLPHAYRGLPREMRQSAQHRVREVLSAYLTDDGLVLPIEMVIAAGRVGAVQGLRSRSLPRVAWRCTGE